MIEGASRFLNAIDDAAGLKQTDLIDLFVYYLTVEQGKNAATATAIDECFKACDLTAPARIAPYLSEGIKTKPQKFIKVDGGYKLQRHFCETLSRRLGADRVAIQTSVELRRLEAKLKPGANKLFLKETIDCFEAGADRATIVMCWILILDHLYDLVLKRHLADFNSKLAAVTDKQVKIPSVSSRDDFGEIREKKFIELLRSANIISNDVRKILDEKLGTRNSCAHPSGVVIRRSKVIDFVEDLVENILLKYPIS